ncbi:hypothetical protein IQ07DRAFT_506253 [Pyrenochaeta sp. DS3sAY3a]|nr:hypothetical protein IQ07DRAFT_506253 [Pyrenochaeta sp. DS3sAY3a]
MRFFGLPHGCALLVVGYLGLGAQGIAQNGGSPDRMLRAAMKRSDLYRRSVRISKRYDSEVSYVEQENGWNGDSTFASQIRVGSQKPILTLEEIEHHLEDVKCDDGVVTLHFVDTSSTRDARAACHGDTGGLIITSHESCNVDGERAVYQVHDASFSGDGDALELSVSKVSWQDAFDQFNITFGHTTDDHLFRRHADFSKIRRKRQDKIDIPADTPDNINTASFDLTSSLLDTTFAAEDFLLGLEEVIPIPALPIEVGCKSCTTRGRLELTQGAINIDASQIDLIPDIFQGGDDGKEITSVITGGFMELAATGVGARLEMFARPTASGAFEIALFALPVFGFVIPGVGKAGVNFEPRIEVDFEVTGGLEITYGLELDVPDNSNVRIELTDITNSGVVGFPGSTLTPLPFNVNVTDVDIRLGLAFKPSIPIGFEFTDKLKAEVVISMGLPRLDALLSTDAAANCGSNSTAPTAPFANSTTNSTDSLLDLGPLVLVEANISLTIDAAVDLALPFLPPAFQAIGQTANLFSTGIPLVTACVNPEDAFKSITGIVPAPTSDIPKFNLTSTSTTSESFAYTARPVGSETAAPCNTTSTHAATKTVHSTSTHTTIIYVPASSHVIKEPPVSSIKHESPSSSSTTTTTTELSTHTSTTSTTTSITEETSLLKIPVQFPISSLPPAVLESSTTSALPVTETPLVFTPPTSSLAPVPEAPPAPVVSMSPGFLIPTTNTSIVPVRQTDVVEFTGAAVQAVEIPGLNWRRAGWQVGAVGASFVFGVLLL